MVSASNTRGPHRFGDNTIAKAIYNLFQAVQNNRKQTFHEKFDETEDEIQVIGGNLVIRADFNARA